MRATPGRLYHNTPSWVGAGAKFHVRVRAERLQRSLIAPKVADDLLVAARRYHELNHWSCELFLIMPDHVHAVLSFPNEPGMMMTIRNWKRGSARFQGVTWQEGFFDH